MLVHNLRQAVQTQLVDDLLPLLADFLQDVRFSRGHIYLNCVLRNPALSTKGRRRAALHLLFIRVLSAKWLINIVHFRSTLSTSGPAIAALVCSLFPQFPITSSDNR